MAIWSEFRKLQGKTIRTLDRRNPFDVSYVGQDTLIVTPQVSGKVRTINREIIESAFIELKTKGELSRSEIQDRYSSFNPAYVAALLSELPGVSYRIRPIVLRYVEESS